MSSVCFMQQHSRKNVSSNNSVGRSGASFVPSPLFEQARSSHFLAAFFLATLQLDYLFIFVYVLFVRSQH